MSSEPANLRALVVLWSLSEAERVGEVLFVDDAERVFGRGGGSGEARVELVKQRPGRNLQTGGSRSPRISRRALRVRDTGVGVRIVNEGRRPLVYRGRTADEVDIPIGGLVELQNELILLCVERPAVLPPCALGGAFGEVDSAGLIGESAPLWSCRRALASLDGGPVQLIADPGPERDLLIGHLRGCGLLAVGADASVPSLARGTRIVLPPLYERREDIPFLARQWMRERIGRGDDSLSPFIDGSGRLRVSPSLVTRLVGLATVTSLRDELDRSVHETTGNYLASAGGA